MKIIKYGIREKSSGSLYGVDTSANNGDFCESVEYSLSSSSDNIWLMDSYNEVEKVIKNPSKWYNASYYSPSHELKTKEVEIVKIELNIEVA